MHREDNSDYLLYIEPPASEKLKKPINDSLTQLMQRALDESEPGGSRYSDLSDNGKFRVGDGWRGFHKTDCGERSTSRDYRLKNGMITNSLCVFYLRYYRKSIPETEMTKLKKLVEFYGISV